MDEPKGAASPGIGLRTLVAMLIFIGGLVLATVKFRSPPNPTTGGSNPSPFIILTTSIPQRDEQVSPVPSPSATPAYIVVYVSGSVRNPDTYQMPVGARVKDAVVAAGGMTDQADASRVNLAEYLYDTQHIHIPARGEAVMPSTGVGGTRSAAPSAGEGDNRSRRLNINLATQSQLEQLEGIGSTLAARIIAYREAHGPFASIEELQYVQGISPALVEKIRSSITVGSEP